MKAVTMAFFWALWLSKPFVKSKMEVVFASCESMYICKQSLVWGGDALLVCLVLAKDKNDVSNMALVRQKCFDCKVH